MQNDLRVSVDCLSFTATSNEYTFEDVVTFLGYKQDDFSRMPKGGNGYKSMIKLDGYPVMILFDGNEDMGIHVSISGSAISEVIGKFKETLEISTPFGNAYLVDNIDNTYMVEFLNAVRRIGTISRIDLAIDDIGSASDEKGQRVALRHEVPYWRGCRQRTGSHHGGNCCQHA